ncbi:MAG: CopG family antitoxin [Kiritimatiellae bacterium]|jgi:predicted DNA binding CopG/RHH family protein|nr:CopG family antitoxin [Kiritimatiellia bacterium]
MKTDNLSKDEELIEDEIELLIPISGKKKEKVSKIIAKAKKNRSISLRVSNYDLEKIKERANAEGIPYQTLINSILHKYITDQLFEKDQVIKSFNLISKA